MNFGKGKKSLMVREKPDVIAPKIYVEVPQNSKARSTTSSSYTTLGHLPKGLHILLESYLIPHVHC